ncbi:ATP-binding SpoIIE family protein phosphatase [Noviherbaspirillum aridicola]|uniref:TorS-related protein n=1 Tax=Noviherbaspirillum aridicola TaxID=2849687 RepID=A0ABQ4Q136_9BURK|nr:ATP-binding SpoIIE family protein phosphatase [Noviherbaspirillum aridicola]GIZ50464.1 TorS-related protein [Noviherbaspirillum aridicola]
MSSQQLILVSHATDIAAARRAGVQLGNALGFDETLSGQLAIAITEAATNILKHAGSGRILIAPAPVPGSAIDVLALDTGPGIRDVAQSMQDGVSTVGTPGNGLGAMRRLSARFDVYSAPGKGTGVFMRIGGGAAPELLEAGAVCVAMPGEDACGDGWSMRADDHGAGLLMSDGLGHGPEAARATAAALAVFEARPGLAPAALIDAAHIALRSTRGAALAAVRLDADNDSLSFAGIGNISACVRTDGDCKQLMSHNGIVGHNMRKVQAFSHPWPADALFVMHSDGLSKQWDLDAYPGLARCHPALIAGILYRDFGRGRDDATVAVIRRRRRT